MPLFGTRGAWQGQERLSAEARRAIQRAEAQGAARGWRQVPPDLLLLALLEEADGVPARALLAVGLDPRDVRDAAAGPPDRAAMPAAERPLLDGAAREAVILGLNEARRSGFEQAGAGHVLLGLLEARTGAGIRLLAQRGVRIGALRALVHELEQAGDDHGVALFAATFPTLLGHIGGASACPQCGVALHASFRYCYNCGLDLGQAG